MIIYDPLEKQSYAECSLLVLEYNRSVRKNKLVLICIPNRNKNQFFKNKDLVTVFVGECGDREEDVVPLQHGWPR